MQACWRDGFLAGLHPISPSLKRGHTAVPALIEPRTGIEQRQLIF
jgi:hypothetical protein